MKRYLFNTEALGGLMLQGDPHKRMLKFETTIDETDESLFPKRTSTPLNEIRSSDLEFDTATETLQIVDDEIKVVPRPAVAPVVPDVVDMWKLKAILDIVGKTAMIETVIAGIPDEDTRVATQAGWKHASTIERGHSLVQAMIAIPSLDIDEEDMDEYFLATKQYDK